MGEIKCEQQEQMTGQMSMALDGLLGAEGLQRLQRHLQECAVCQTEWQAMQQVSMLLEQAPQVGPPLGFAVRVGRRLNEKIRQRRRAFSGLAVLTGSLSLASVTVAGAVLLVLGWLVWHNRGPVTDVQQGSNAVSQIASGMGLVGKGASLFLVDMLLRYGPPLVFLIGVGLLILAGIWVWLFLRRPGSSHHNGYA
mgnify:CR=1 FL=1